MCYTCNVDIWIDWYIKVNKKKKNKKKKNVLSKLLANEYVQIQRQCCKTFSWKDKNK